MKMINNFVEMVNGQQPLISELYRSPKGDFDELKAMAGFFAKKKWVARPQVTDAKKVAAGAKLHKKHCEKCHEENGRESEDGGSVAAVALSGFPCLSLGAAQKRVVVVGGGAGGQSPHANLRMNDPSIEVTLIEPRAFSVVTVSSRKKAR